MPVPAPSAAAQAVRAKYVDIATKHNDNLSEIDQLQQAAFQDVLPAVLSEVGLEDDAQAERHVRTFLKDKGLLFRFYRRGRYSASTALDMLTATLTWRLRTDLDSLSLASLHPLYTSPQGRPPLFWCNSHCTDLYGRPMGVISLQSLERVTHDDGQAGLEECREYIVGCMESVRRYLAVQYAQSSARRKTRKIDLEQIQASIEEEGGEDTDAAGRKANEYRPPAMQMVIVFSLASSGMANLELELLPFLLDLLKNHFPGMVGAVYILHFGWVHSGMWALAKRVLPQQALARIFFPSTKELAEHFELAKLPEAFGGDLEMEMVDETNDVMHKYARPHWNARLSRSSSRSDVNLSAMNAAREKEDEEEKDGEADGEGDVENVEVSSAPPSPRGQSGTSTPLFARTPGTLSRAGSFESLVDEFYSLANSPNLSRSATPRPSRPTTPHAEMSGFQLTSANSNNNFAGLSPATSHLRLTPAAVNKLQRVQLMRGSGLRSRTSSDAATLTNFDRTHIRSPARSRDVSPERLRRRQRAVSTQGALATSGSMKSRNSVRFDNENALGISGSGHGAGRAGSGEGNPIKRVGSLRDFRLSLSDLAQPDAGIEATDVESSSGESDHSGKATERTDHREPIEQPSRARRFFSLLRRKGLAANGASAVAREGESGKDEEQDGAPTLPPSDTLATLPPEPVSPGSPQLQVPDIEEPPLSEMPRMFSRRSKLHDMPGHVSPYNSANPFYGYPAYPSNPAGGPSGGTVRTITSNDPRRRYHFRRRKRDLVRTLMYLFVLRLLALHRHVRTALMATYRGTLRAISVGGLSFDHDFSGMDALQQTQQYQRYQRLRSAGAQFRAEGGEALSASSSATSIRRPLPVRRATGQDAQSSLSVSTALNRPKPQPLVALGFRKRYAILMIIIAFTLLRREWQMRRRMY